MTRPTRHLAPATHRPHGRLVLAACLLTFLMGLPAEPAQAHDFWIQPTTFRPVAGEVVGLDLRVGQGFVGDPLPRDPDLLAAFTAAGPDGASAPVPGIDGRRPAGVLRPEASGPWVLGYTSRPSVVTLDADKLALYVRQEGLDAQLGPDWRHDAPVRDAFSRCAKTLLRVDGGSGAADGAVGFARPLGLPLELVPLADPTALAGGGALPVELLDRGKPLAGIQVTALARADPETAVTATTGSDGRVMLTLPHGGEWLIKAVKVVRTPAAADADYRSQWASLTFETRPAGDAADGAAGR